MMVFVQFKDPSKEVVVAIFSCAQDPEVWPIVEEVSDNDPRYLEFMDKNK